MQTNWPDKERRLGDVQMNTGAQDWCDIKWLTDCLDHTDASIAQYFQNAADHLVDVVAEKRQGNIDDGLFIPIAYLYRHAVELRLKDIIRLGVNADLITTEEASDINLLREHRLEKLWDLAVKGIMRYWPDGETKILDNSRLVIANLHNMDPDGQGFRYATKQNKKESSANYPRAVVLTDFRETIQGVLNLLYACSGAFEGVLDMHNEQ